MCQQSSGGLKVVSHWPEDGRTMYEWNNEPWEMTC